jgi:hypothetical protein
MYSMSRQYCSGHVPAGLEIGRATEATAPSATGPRAEQVELVPQRASASATI